MTGSFRVTGFVQSVNLQGELCQLTLEGYQTLCKELPTPDLYVYLNSDVDAAEVAARYKESGLVLDTVNAQKLQTEARSMYMGITVAAVAVIFAVTVLIVLFILYIVIKSLLVKRRQELGIYKAMGYTSAQLMAQTVASFLPVSAAAVLLSTGAAVLYLPGIYQVIFGALGVMKNNMEIDLGFLMLFALAQILVNVIISVILCMPIRKISAYALMKE
jgi:putative ABC transport system permease protein